MELGNILETKWAKHVLKRLSRRERACLITKLSNFNVVRSTEYAQEFLDLYDMKCIICGSEDKCFVAMLGLIEKKAEMLGVIDDAFILKIENSLTKQIEPSKLDFVDVLREVLKLFTEKYK